MLALPITNAQEAAVDKTATARAILSDYTDKCFQGILVHEVKEILYTGPILHIPDTQASTPFQMQVRFSVEGSVVAQGDAMLMRVQPTDHDAGGVPQFSNRLCVGITCDDRVAVAYTPGQIVPMVVGSVRSYAGDKQFYAEVVPWTIAGTAAPLLVATGPADPAVAGQIVRDAAAIAESRVGIARWKEVAKAMGLRPAPADAASFADALQMLGQGPPRQVMLALNAGHGSVSVYEVPAGVPAAQRAAAFPLEQGLMLLLLRESGLVTMGGELVELHGDALTASSQKAVWAIVKNATPVLA